MKQHPRFFAVRVVPSARAGYTPGQFVVQYKDANGMWFDIGDPKSKEGANAALKIAAQLVIK